MNIIDSRINPYDDEELGTDRTCASFVIRSGNINPVELSKIFNLEPTHIRIKGTVYPRSGNTETFNVWCLESEEFVISKELRRHLDWLLDKLDPIAQQILDLQTEQGVQMNVYCPWWSTSKDGGGIVLWPEQMIRLAKLNLECAIDISYYGSEDEFQDE